MLCVGLPARAEKRVPVLKEWPLVYACPALHSMQALQHLQQSVLSGDGTTQQDTKTEPTQLTSMCSYKRGLCITSESDLAHKGE